MTFKVSHQMKSETIIKSVKSNLNRLFDPDYKLSSLFSLPIAFYLHVPFLTFLYHTLNKSSHFLIYICFIKKSGSQIFNIIFIDFDLIIDINTKNQFSGEESCKVKNLSFCWTTYLDEHRKSSVFGEQLKSINIWFWWIVDFGWRFWWIINVVSRTIFAFYGEQSLYTMDFDSTMMKITIFISFLWWINFLYNELWFHYDEHHVVHQFSLWRCFFFKSQRSYVLFEDPKMLTILHSCLHNYMLQLILWTYGLMAHNN